MANSASLFIFVILLSCVAARSPEGSVCLLEDPKNQCGSFCLSVLKPLLDHIAKHQDQLNILAKQQENLVSNGNETLNKLESIISQDLGARLDRMEWKLIEKITESQQISESQVKGLREQLSSLQNSTEFKYIPSNFEKIGNRFFYIERSIKLNWFAASDTCRRVGGQLAIIENEEERIAVAAKVNDPGAVGFWLDIHNLANSSEYTSSATGTVAPFIKWGRNQPNVEDEDCVALDAGTMHDYNCVTKLFFICQA
ncbi:hypothetical protein KR054_008618 [Drosophila jambulina]|nr:hypothetical protein KR054_008618 [Drosophila jambulina]